MSRPTTDTALLAYLDAHGTDGPIPEGATPGVYAVRLMDRRGEIDLVLLDASGEIDVGGCSARRWDVLRYVGPLELVLPGAMAEAETPQGCGICVPLGDSHTLDVATTSEAWVSLRRDVLRHAPLRLAAPGEVARLTAERDAALAEVERLRAVVENAGAWRAESEANEAILRADRERLWTVLRDVRSMAAASLRNGDPAPREALRVFCEMADAALTEVEP